MDRLELFLEVFEKVKKKYGQNKYRLAGEAWKKDWQTLIATIMSAQSRDETTIPIAENLFSKYPQLTDLANAKQEEVLVVFKSLNYNRTKAKNVINAAKFILNEFGGKLPSEINELARIPGVGRKTANLVLWEEHKIQAICVDTHVHRICNVLGLVNTKTPEMTEIALMKYIPKKYWGRINRYFVLWGKDIVGQDKRKLMDHLET